ncbi:MAG: hypothetical protein A2725_00990 [Candidatus Magasanikbacteria bacterium RIFCSPHIGHO2_01_FULL_33_34]|uniref:DUF4956 domain-containing protein n=1 Tax=Candidatus Magasanikbacteria bacterium RIFCSPHIGHO2_01_FULL_33_34 TaxID=1798671 RepID=A0A1F6LIZ5_9BACT|nr:MAG: hypothetical protein A2725_00990 [Candidatus Magasanikbacteria bacterium RIFCSPHIGHO2_01_FULL_33_34]OGH65331.1 MAG: hypothetical protein A3B83_04650 [Candidatus Magasanikbacteria bacterium RIFCSPHIGHO2_02_FULL_33_17]OGH76107.1 MAG: hypothetical protein A3A89_01570 [Candidatus Magasanikbacteria bacterium RIFCSPLOWO2_01_FULL_33_34]
MAELFSGGTVTYSMSQIVLNIVLTFVLSFVIAMVYKKTHKGLSYSQSFVFTLVLMSVIVSVVMMVIGNSLARAFGLLGAFSIIRFRTAVKDTKDTGYIFFALAIGMAVGTGSYSIAVIGTVLILLIILILDKINFGSMRKHEYLLSFVVNHDEGAGNSFESVFKKHLKNSMLLNINSKRDGKASEMTYHASFVDENKKEDFVRELSGMSGVEKVHLITSKEDVEY